MLNAEQKKAVDTIEGPVMVIAGPGTGKTQILTLRIANILKQTDTTPDSILALTFTEAASANMRRRLVSIVGSAGYYVNIFTFHGFCNHIIQEYPERFPSIIGFNNASRVDQIDIIRSIIKIKSFTYLKPFGDNFFHVSNIIGGISDLKKEAIGALEFKKIIKKEKKEFKKRDDLYHKKGAHKGKMKVMHQKEIRQFEKNEELAYFYEEYQKELSERKFYDFADMLLAVIFEFKTNKDFLLEIQEKYHYILVDEHQDTNGAQNAILELLCSFFPNPNLFVVGDEKQAIYRFQGASLDNFLYFKDKFEGVQLVSLVNNYRSTQKILDGSQSLIEKQSMKPLSKPLVSAARGDGEKIHTYAFATEDGERLFLAQAIKKMIKDGIPPEEIAILYRQNSDAFPVADFFEREGIPFVIESDQNILADIEIRKINLLFEAIGDFGNDVKLVKALHMNFLEIDPLDIYVLTNEAKKKYTSVHSLLKDKRALKKLGLKDEKKLTNFYSSMESWRTLSFNTDFLDFFVTVARESHFINHLIKHNNRVEKLDKLSTLFGELKHIVEHHRDYSLPDYLYYLEILLDHGVSIKANTKQAKQSVHLMTAHKAKGLEFDYVFIIGAYDGHWGNKRKMATFSLPTKIKITDSPLERNEDERRLFYMALTRARVHATITYARYSPEGRERVPSQFIGEISEEFLEERRGERFDDTFKKESHFKPISTAGGLQDVEEFLRERFLKQGLSPTALNSYLNCPWRYYFNNLVRIPMAQSHHQVYGILIHKVLEEFFNAKNEGKRIGVKFLKERFLYHLAKQSISERLLEQIKDKGLKTLASYHDNYKSLWNYNTVNEYHIKGVTVAPGIKITGKLDKLEIVDDKENVIVVDYKTKKPQSRNWIEGKTKTSTGDFYRQLVFYKLLLDEMPNNRYRMISGSIDFIEPDDKGRFKVEVFEITDEDVTELKETIKRVATEILEMDFWDRRCDDTKCSYCILRDMM